MGMARMAKTMAMVTAMAKVTALVFIVGSVIVVVESRAANLICW